MNVTGKAACAVRSLAAAGLVLLASACQDDASTTSNRDAGADLPLDFASDGADDLDAGTLDAADSDEPGQEEPLSGDPPGILLTVAGLPAEMNGSHTFSNEDELEESFALRVNRENVDLEVRLTPESGPVYWDTLELRCDVDLILNGSPIAANEPIPVGTLQIDGERRRFLRFDAGTSLPARDLVSCESRVDGVGEQATSALSFATASMAPALDPFPTEDVWVLDFSRDHWSDGRLPSDDGAFAITAERTPGGDGIADFEEAMRHLGLMSGENEAADTAMMQVLTQGIADRARSCFDFGDDRDPPIRIEVSDPEGRFHPEAFEYGPRNAHHFSLMAVGGWGESGSCDFFGLAGFDWNNQVPNDNWDRVGFGVLVNCMVSLLLSDPISVTQLSRLLPGLGQPFGTVEGDAQWLSPDFDPDSLEGEVRARYGELRLVLDAGIAFTAITACHEIGHSIGLVPNGPPPNGLFGGLSSAEWMGERASFGHLDTGHNIMASRSDLSDALEMALNPLEFMPLSRAYLQRQLVVGQRAPLIEIRAFDPEDRPVQGASICLLDDEMSLGCGTAGASGGVSFLTDAGRRLTAVLSGDGLAPTLGMLLSANQTRYGFELVSQQSLDDWAEQAEVSPSDDKGIVVVRLRDCLGPCTPLADPLLHWSREVPPAFVSTSAGEPLVAESALAPGSTWDTAVVFDVHPGEIQLTIEAGDLVCGSSRFDFSVGYDRRGDYRVMEGATTLVVFECL